jgi:Ulp1 family protease
MKNQCAPLSKNEESCFNTTELLQIAKAYNNYIKKNKKICLENICITEKINIKNNKKYLYKEIYKKLSKLYESEINWIDFEFINSIKDPDMIEKLKYFTFKPKMLGKDTWLSTSDIDLVMNQYINMYENAQYVGALPSDFYKITELNYKKLFKTSLTLIVLNTDPHNKQGQHWVAMSIDNIKQKIEYFDSLGEKPNRNIKKFIKNLNEYKPNYETEISLVKHQYKNIDC